MGHDNRHEAMASAIRAKLLLIHALHPDVEQGGATLDFHRGGFRFRSLVALCLEFIGVPPCDAVAAEHFLPMALWQSG